ncbi:MAG: right-handed parallel beta-helix repeat-containing protein, partial [Planctomycetota bacterium]
GQTVTLNGCKRITGSWSQHSTNIYKTKVDDAIEQLFLDRKMMIEARWPNIRFEQILGRSGWAKAEPGSCYGKMVDSKLADTDTDWTSALAILNVAHQFYTWSRTVTEHTQGSDTFAYAKNLNGITSYADKTRPWENDYYYLTGKFEALDAPTEWFYDSADGMLYLYADDGKSPASRNVEYKKRNYAFDVSGRDYVELYSLGFFATTLRLLECNHCVVENCRLLFPSYCRRLTELDPAPKRSPVTKIRGNYNTVRTTSIAYASNSGLVVTGAANVVENCIIHDVGWKGSLHHAGLAVSAGKDSVCSYNKNIIRRNTVYNAGNAALTFAGSNIIEYNHVYNGGLACMDVALLCTGKPTCAGSVIRYNWVHGCHTEDGGGLGIRGDDQSRHLTVHHNVVWDCGRDGIIVKGDFNRVYNNTVFDIGSNVRKEGNYICLRKRPEPKKPWANQYPLLKVQNANSYIFNNAARTITSDRNEKPFPAGKNVSNNYQGTDLMLSSPEHFDFRPTARSPLIDAGRKIPESCQNFRGKAPDIGAYEYEAAQWRAGADWHDGL